MAFPWIFESNFEAGTNAEWDSETDTASQLDFPHYKELARFPWPTCLPLSGAYCARISLTGGTADATLTEGDINIAAGANRFAGFGIWFSPDFDATANDTVHLLEFQQAGGTVEATFGFRYVASTDVINLGIGETAPTSFGSTSILKGVWYWVDLDLTVDAGTENNGTIDMYVTRVGDPASTAVDASQVASLDQGAVGQGVLGVQAQLATTTGTILIDNFVFDDARVFPPRDRYPTEVLLTKSGHAFVGGGKVSNVTLLSGAGTDNVLKIFDTDTADANNAESAVLELKNTANNETVDPAGVPVRVHRGCYVELSGTNPRALLQVDRGLRSDAQIRNWGLR